MEQIRLILSSPKIYIFFRGTIHLSGRSYNLNTSPSEMKIHSLITLYLSINYFITISEWLFESCHHLEYLNFSKNNLQGTIPYSIERTKTLAILDLSHNIVIDWIPDSIDKQVNFVAFDLSYNNFNASLPSTLGQVYGLNSLKESCLSNKIISYANLMSLKTILWKLDFTLVFFENISLRCIFFVKLQLISELQSQMYLWNLC